MGRCLRQVVCFYVLALGICFTLNPAKCFSILLTTATYLTNSGSFATNVFLMCPTTTYELDLMMHLQMPSALSFRRPNRTASNSAMLLVVGNCSRATYLSFGPFGGVRMVVIPTLDAPHAISQCIIHTSSSSCRVVSKAEGVQSTIKYASTWDFDH